MKKLLPLLVVLGACAPDITQDAQPGEAIIVEFDPAAAVPVVPLPNDLAIDAKTGKIVVPASPTDSPAQKEFNEKYLQTLDGFPFESTGTVGLSGDLNPASVNAKTVLAFDVTASPPVPVSIAPVFANKTISVPPPAGNWLRGHRYAIALLGGANGLRGAANQDVIGSATWALASSRHSLVNCPATASGAPDYASPDCLPAVDVIPSAKTDPVERLADQTASAIKLEQIRLAYAPILDALAAPPLATDRSNIPIVWTFKIVDAGEMTFDPSKSIIPFPNDLLRTGKDAAGNPRVALPNPKTGAPLTDADCAAATDTSTQLYCGLNTLDGFSTIAPPISENSDKEGALDQGNIDPASLSAKTVGLVPLKSAAPLAIQTKPQYTPCLNCVSTADATGKPQTSPQQLQWKLDAPLDEKTTYFGFVTSAVKDDKGKAVIANPIFALIRSSQPLVDKDGKSTVSIISDAQAKQLEPVRAGFAPAFDGLKAAGIERESLALAFPFTTQSESTILEQLTTVPAAAKAKGLPDYPIDPTGLKDETATYKGILTAGGVPAPAVAMIGKVFSGIIYSPVAVTSPQGTFQAGLAGIKLEPVRFLISIPAAAPLGGAAAYPVTIFGHGFTRTRNDFIALAPALSQAGQVVIATDVLFHGERTTCTGSKSATAASLPAGVAPSDDFACASPAAGGGTMTCDGGSPQGLCVLKLDSARAACAPSATDPLGDGACAVAAGGSQGRCAADGKCQGVGADLARDAASGAPKISGWNVFSLTNFFATRDNLRQQVIDLSQLVAVLKSTDAKKLGNQLFVANGNAAVPLDATKINYVGQSLGGIEGALFNAVSPDTNNVVLNVPGGNLPLIILTAPSFVAQKTALLQGLAALGLQPGTPAFDQFLGTVQWILDPADPANMGYRLTHGANGAPNANRKAFIQFIQGDETVPNLTNFALVKAANRSFVATPPNFGCVAPLLCYEFTEAGDGFDATSAPTNKRHGFMLSPPSATAGGLAITTKAQTQVATFLASGTLPP